MGYFFVNLPTFFRVYRFRGNLLQPFAYSAQFPHLRNMPLNTNPLHNVLLGKYQLIVLKDFL